MGEPFPLSPGQVKARLQVLGFCPWQVEPIPADASFRRFYRAHLQDGATVVAATYPPQAFDQAAHHGQVQRWAWSHQLPVPRLLAEADGFLVSQDLGTAHVRELLSGPWEELPIKLLACLARFQRCGEKNAPNPPFDAAFFYQELTPLLTFKPLSPKALAEAEHYFLQLAHTLQRHPYRLLHRDFHVDNLLLFQGEVWTVDFQDLRWGPEAYDLVSLTRERGALGSPRLPSLDHSAAALGWKGDYHRRYWECAAQRGLKVLATFLRLVYQGRSRYARFLPEAAHAALEALAHLQAPPVVRELVASWAAPAEENSPAPSHGRGEGS